MCSQENEIREASRWIKWAVSAVIAVHFFAILTAVTGLAVGYAPPPRLCAEANHKFAPYLELVFLQNPYRFYAPNPGCDPTMWVRIHYSDGSVRWLDFPRLSESAAPVLKQRLLAMPRSAVETVPAGENPGDVMLSPMSQICLASYVRGLVRSHAIDSADGWPVLTEDVEVYRIDQRCMLPFEAREDWQFADLRLREAKYLGTFFVNGKMREGPRGEPVPMPELAARIIQESIASEPSPILPRPIVALLQQHPNLSEGDEADLAERVRVAIEGDSGSLELAEPLELAVDGTARKQSDDDRNSMSPQYSERAALAARSP
jgi:hypothetical protein